jgi:glucuronate isomerase
MLQRSPLSPDRFFAAEPVQRKIARQLYDSVMNLPLVCPQFRIEPSMQLPLAESVMDPLELLVLPDNYIMNRLKAHGFLQDGSNYSKNSEKEAAHRKFWQFFVDNASSLRGMPADIWLAEILHSVFGIKDKLVSKNAQRIYNAISDSLKQPEFQFPRLIERFNIEALGVIDSPIDPHLELFKSSPGSKVIPCFHPDVLFQITDPEWPARIHQLSLVCQSPISDAGSFIQAIQKQLLFFKSLGATTILQSIFKDEPGDPSTADLECIFARAFQQQATAEDGMRFSNLMLSQMAAMSATENLALHVKQRVGILHSEHSKPVDYSTGLMDLLCAFGQNPSATIILCPDERIPFESLKPLSDAYPSLKIGAPEWFFNGLSSMQKYYDECLENIGLNKSAGLTNQFLSLLTIPAQHDIWRRSGANWLAKLVVCGLVDLENAYEMIYAMAYGLARSAYKLQPA